MTLTFGSLFSGIGGFDLAFTNMGMECKWQVEWDKSCQSVLARHWPDVPRFGDIRSVGNGELEPVDVLCGGFPCQDLSVAGKRAGLAGERSGLWHEFARIIGELAPRWVVVENVPGLLSSNGGRDFATVIRGLVELGYGVAWRILDAQYFGVAQRRRRVFIVGHLGNGRSTEILFESEGVYWDSPPSREKEEGVAGSLAAGAHPSGFNGQDAYAGHIVATSFRTNQTGAKGPIHSEEITDSLAQDHPPAIVCQVDGDDQAATLRGFGHGWQGQHNTTNAIVTTCDTVGAMQANAGTERKHGDGGISGWQIYMAGYIQPQSMGVRRLTPTECERLQGFPKGFTDGQADSTRYRQLGNAVCVPVVEWIGRRIAAIEKGEQP